jgi:hypothetical protein
LAQGKRPALTLAILAAQIRIAETFYESECQRVGNPLIRQIPWLRVFVEGVVIVGNLRPDTQGSPPIR